MKVSEARHAFITGGASGIGLGIADALASRGIAVTIADVDAEAIEQALASRGALFRGATLDTRDRSGWTIAKEEAEAAFGPVDILVNNAGIAPNGKEFADMDAESFDRILAINLVGVFNGVHAFAADFRARGRGHIVNTSSMAGLASSIPGVGAYSVAKYGVTALSEALRTEMAPHGVAVSVLCPGFVPTNLPANTRKLGGDMREYKGDAPMPPGIPADRIGETVAQAIDRNDFYIITHPGSWRSIGSRMAEIEAACAAADAAG